jgi:hypothetical protein
MICIFGGKMEEKNNPGQDVAEDPETGDPVVSFLRRRDSAHRKQEYRKRNQHHWIRHSSK